MKGLIAFVLCATAVYGATVPIGTVNRPVVQEPVHGVSVPIENVNQQQHEQVHPPVGIVSQNMEVNPDGSFINVFESENGIKVAEEGSPKVVDENVVNTISGSVTYTDNDGNVFTLTYEADENGFHPTGDHLPTPPPVPISVARALEYIAAHPYVEKLEKNVASVKTEGAPIVEDL